MKLVLVVEPAAEEDIFYGYRWYEERRVGLGVKFLEVLGSLFDHILENPLSYVEAIPGVRRSVILSWLPGPSKNSSMPATDQFVFLNKEGEMSGPGSWNDAARGKLWLFILHYFDDLNAVGASERMDWHRALIQRWVEENPPTAGSATILTEGGKWELIINFIKYKCFSKC